MVKIEWINDFTPSCAMNRTIIKNKATPWSIVVYPERGYLFWAEFYFDPSKWPMMAVIYRANLDGTDIRALVQFPRVAELNGPLFTLDYDEDKLYWDDPDAASIRSIDINGRNETKVFNYRSNCRTYMNALAISNNFLLWSGGGTLCYTEKGKIMYLVIIKERVNKFAYFTNRWKA